jgi:fructose-bisphosphate aldolase class II
MQANVESLKKQLQHFPDKNYWELMHQTENESIEIVKHYIDLSGSEGKSGCANYLFSL